MLVSWFAASWMSTLVTSDFGTSTTAFFASVYTSYNMRVVVFKVPLQELEEKCYTVTDAVDRYVYLPQDGFKEAPTTALYEFVN